MESLDVEDDDLFVIIVGDEKDKQKQQVRRSKKQARETKSKVDDAEEDTDIEIHDIKVEVEVERIGSKDTFQEDDSDNMDEDYVLDFSKKKSKGTKCRNIIKTIPEKRRNNLLALEDQKSFVNELRQQDPTLKDKELLIDTLSAIMANSKCPTPPPDFVRKNDNWFECGNCGLKKDTKMAVARHWQDRHGPRCLVCYACGADFRSVVNLYKHEKRCNSPDAIIVLKARARIRKYKGICPGRPFQLPDEYFDKKSYISLLRQMRPEIAQNRELLIQMLCEKMSEEKMPDPPEDFFVMNNNLFECKTCGVTNVSRTALARHWQWLHGPRYLECYTCGKDYRDSRNLYKHEKRCTEPGACAVLAARARTITRRGRVGNNPSPSSDNINDRKKGKLYSCSMCPAEFKIQKSLEAHQLAHSGARPFRCDSCPARYTSSSALSRHKEKHKDITYLCHQCERTFKCKAALKSHLDSHLPQRKYPCPHCEKRYAQRTALQIHIDRVHLRLPPACACQICPKRYPRMSLLKVHMLKEHGMNLITRNMFYRSLPHLSDSQLKNAKIVKKSDLQRKSIEIPTREEDKDTFNGPLAKKPQQGGDIINKNVITDVNNSMKNKPQVDLKKAESPLKVNAKFEEEVISATNRVVTIKNCESAEMRQTERSIKIEAKKRLRRKRKKY